MDMKGAIMSRAYLRKMQSFKPYSRISEEPRDCFDTCHLSTNGSIYIVQLTQFLLRIGAQGKSFPTNQMLLQKYKKKNAFVFKMAGQCEKDKCNTNDLNSKYCECGDKIKSGASKASDKVKEAGEKVGDKMKNTDVNSKCEKCKEDAKCGIDKAGDNAKGMDLGGKCRECGEKVNSGFHKAGENVKKAGQNVGEKMKNTDLAEVCEKCKEKTKKAGQAVKEGAKDALDKTKEVMGNATNQNKPGQNK